MKHKRLIQLLCTLLAVLMLMGALPVMSSSAEYYHTKESDYNRYYFYMPESWYNEYATDAHIYWWEGTGACGAWPGYKAIKTDVPGVYYYDVSKDVTTIVWNNGIDGVTYYCYSCYYNHY